MATAHPPLDSVPNASLSNGALLARARRLGRATLRTRQKFLATLPEIVDRDLVSSRYSGIFEYAARQGGASRKQVRNVLSLHGRLRPFPGIWALVESGTRSYATVERVPLALIERDPDLWEDKIANQTRDALLKDIKAAMAKLAQELAPREGRGAGPSPKGEEGATPDAGKGSMSKGGEEATSENGERSAAEAGEGARSDDWETARKGGSHRKGAARHGPEDRSAPRARAVGEDEGARSSFGDVRAMLRLLDPATRGRLEILQKERSALAGRKLTFVELLRAVINETFLDERPPGENPATPAERQAIHQRAVEVAARTPASAPVPVAVKRDVCVRSGGLCEVGGCYDPGEHLHHQIKKGARRSSLPPELRDLPRQDPRVVVHLCEAHHELVHAGRFADALRPPAEWILLDPEDPGCADEVDVLCEANRRWAKAWREAEDHFLELCGEAGRLVDDVVWIHDSGDETSVRVGTERRSNRAA